MLNFYPLIHPFLHLHYEKPKSNRTFANCFEAKFVVFTQFMQHFTQNNGL